MFCVQLFKCVSVQKVRVYLLERESGEGGDRERKEGDCNGEEVVSTS